MNPPEGFTLHVNWNKNIIPKDKHMKCEVTEIMGKMIKINGVGFDFINKKDLNTTWEGWIPKKSILLLKEI